MNTPDSSGSLFATGTIIGGTYRILDFIGQGGMGYVFKVEHVMMAKIMALKALRPEQVSAEVWQRFRTEAQAIARLNHGNIVKIYDMSQTETGLPYYTMDLLTGVSLSDYMLEVGKLSEQEALPIFRQVCSALGYAHDHGIIHRDIKPANIMLTNAVGTSQTPLVKIVDFGIAKLQSYDSNVAQGLTKPGEVFGSPLYMSPEQAGGRQLDYRTDMYSLGVTMFQALTGKPPLVGNTAFETVAKHQTEVAPSLRSMAPDDQFSHALEEVVARLLAKQPEQRFASLYDVEKQLKALEHGTTVDSRIRHPARSSESSGSAQWSVPANFRDDDDDQSDEEAKSTSFSTKSYLLLPLGSLLIMAIITAGVYNIYTQHQANLAASKAKQKPIFTSLDAVTHEQDRVLETESDYSYVMKPEEDKRIQQLLAQRKTPYSHFSPDRNYLIFDFPSDINLGIISYQRNGASEYIRNDAKGQLKIPAGMLNHFEAGNCTKIYPDLIKFFKPEDLNGVAFNEMAKKNPRVGPNLMRLTKTRQLDLSQSAVDDKDLTWLDNMKSVSHLNLGLTYITGEKFSKSKIFSRLKAFEIDGMKNITAVLEKISHERHLEYISLGSTKPTAKDFDLLSKLSHLDRLGFHNATLKDEYLASLVEMQSLKELNLYRCGGLTHKCFKHLKELKNLRLLCLPADVLSPQEVAELKRVLTKTRIVEG